MTEQPKKSHHRTIPRRTEQTKERADAAFLVYIQLGEKRSIAKLWGQLRLIGVKISLKRIEQWSAEFHWQERLLRYQAELERRRVTEGVDALEEMDNRHIQLNKALGSLAAAGISHYQEMITDAQAKGKRGLNMDISDIIGLISQAQRGERLARGLATSKAEVIVEVLPPLVKDLYAVFLAVNVLTNDPPEMVQKREAEYIQRGDQVLSQYYGKVKEIPEERTIISGNNDR